MAITKRLFLGVCIFLTLFSTSQTAIEPVSEEEAEQWLKNNVPKYETLKSAFQTQKHDFYMNYYPQFGSAQWNGVITKLNAMNTYHHELGLVTSASDWRDFDEGTVRRQFMYLAALGVDALRPTVNYLAGSVDYNRSREIKSIMSSAISKAKICKDDTTCYTERGLTKFIEDPTTGEQDLLWAWQTWRDATGKKSRSQYPEYTALLNKAAKMQGYPDMGAMRRFEYEMDGSMPDVMTSLVEKLLPKFKLLHGYVRRQLIKEHGDDARTKTGHIPAHLIRNIWSQDWRKTIKLPFDWTRSDIDAEADAAIKEKCADADPRTAAKKLWKLAETFYTDNGLNPLPESFWESAKLVKDECKMCTFFPWNFFNGTVSVSACTRLSYRSSGLLNAVCTLAYVKRMQAYSDKPTVFQNAPNRGFGRGTVDPFTYLTGWKIQTLKHLDLISDQTFNDFNNNKEAKINLLMEEALLVFPWIIYSYNFDSWRWEVQNGDIKSENYNAGWWKKLCKYQGISPPVSRSEEDFDPGSFKEIAKTMRYIQEAVRKIVSFQLHKAFCEKAFPNETPPLHECVYFDKNVGELIRKLFEPGRSQPWQDTLEDVTGEDSMDVEPLLEYFEPLFDWLKEEQKKACEEEQTEAACDEDSFGESCDSAPELRDLTMSEDDPEFEEE